jgi:hypothetical protein
MNELPFKPLSSEALTSILGLTIKQDEINKLVTFLCELSAYTDSSQFNISYNAPSSSGKSYIPTEVARLFPEEDVMEVGYCSPTAFFHDTGTFNKEDKTFTVDLSGKILIFLDQPHMMLMQHLRPLLSHDKKEIRIKITDKKEKFGIKTKNIILKGYPAVIFCTAGLKIDEQEATRFLLLSPEINQEKIRAGVTQIIKKEADNEQFSQWLNADPERELLKQRIEAIKQAGIKEIKIAPELQVVIEDKFLSGNKILKPRHQRDIKRLMALIKLFAVLNFWWRNQQGSTITATQEDITEAFKVWDSISESQELNLPPYIYNLYKEAILPAYIEKNREQDSGVNTNQLMLGEKPKAQGLSRQDIAQQHHKVYGRYIPEWQLRQQIVPMLELAGLIYQEPDPTDRRKVLIYPTTELTVSGENKNRELDGGVTSEPEVQEMEWDEIMKETGQEGENTVLT